MECKREPQFLSVWILDTALELQKSGGKSQTSDVIPWAQAFKFFGTWRGVLLTLGKASATWLGTMAPLGSLLIQAAGDFSFLL